MPTDRYMFFSAKELKCKCGDCEYGQHSMDPFFMSRLIELRMEADFPFPVTSAIRCEDYEARLKGSGIHPTGHAVDINVYGYHAFWIISNAGRYGFRGIGIKQHGPYNKRFIHLDDAPPSGPNSAPLDSCRPRPWVWTYK